MLGQHRKRWTNIIPALGQCLVLAGMHRLLEDLKSLEKQNCGYILFSKSERKRQKMGCQWNTDLSLCLSFHYITHHCKNASQNQYTSGVSV